MTIDGTEQELQELDSLIDKYNEAFPRNPYIMQGIQVLPYSDIIKLLKAALSRNKPYSLEEWDEILGLGPDDIT